MVETWFNGAVRRNRSGCETEIGRAHSENTFSGDCSFDLSSCIYARNVRSCMRAEHLSARSRDTGIQREWNISPMYALVIDHVGIPQVSARTWFPCPSVPVMSVFFVGHRLFVPSFVSIFFSFSLLSPFLSSDFLSMRFSFFAEKLRRLQWRSTLPGYVKYNRIFMRRANLRYH